MSKLPAELRDLLADGKHAHEPDPTRLNAVYQRVLNGAGVASPYDTPPPSPSSSLGKPWGWFTVVGASVVSVALWMSKPAPPPALVARHEPHVLQHDPRLEPHAPRVQATVAPTVTSARPIVVEPLVVEPLAVEPLAVEPLTIEPLAIPSSDWPVASPVAARVASRRARREPQEAAPTPQTVESAPVAVPEAPPRIETPPSPPSAQPMPTEASASSEASSTVVTRKVHRDAAASLREEVGLITRARQALAKGDWRAAQRALDEHQLEHPVGQLHIERRALWARARCLAGDLAGARRIHGELLTLAPGTALLRGLERACPDVVR